MITKEQKKYSTDLTALNKAFRIYIQEIDKSSALKIETEDLTYSDFFDDKMLIIRSIREGLPYKLFSKIKEITPFTEDDWAEYLDLSKKTLHRYRKDVNFYFKPIHTEKIIELAEVTNFGKEVFDSTKQFYLWLNTPSYAFGYYGSICASDFGLLVPGISV